MLRPAPCIVGLVAVQRLVELGHSRRNERRLRSNGATEAGADHYRVMVALHGAWLASTLAEGWRCRRFGRAALGGVVVAQLLRWWAIASLGDQWTTRVLVDRTRAPVVAGPYRWIRHPNYVAVQLEIVCLPLALRARSSAATWGIANAVLLRHRVGVEEEARSRRSQFRRSAAASRRG